MIHVSGTPRFPGHVRGMMRAMPGEGVGRLAHQLAADRDDMNFTAGTLSAITARTLIVHGDRDPLYPVELAVELYRGITGSALWVVPNGGTGRSSATRPRRLPRRHRIPGSVGLLRAGFEADTRGS